MLRVRHLIRHVSMARAASRAMSNQTDPVLIEERGNNYLITLNRPKSLNALSLAMVQALTPLYEKLHDEKEERVVVLKGAGGKAFCAGGDVRSLYDMKQEGKSPKEIIQFFREEYHLNELIGTLPPNILQVSLLNGITMGGGVGLSVHGKIRVATDNTLFAMPETELGFFPDVGGSYFLPRLKPVGLGMYLALTGAKLKGGAVTHAGVATHFCATAGLDDLETKLLGAGSVDDAMNILTEGATDDPDEGVEFFENRKAIIKHFSKVSVEKILDSLVNDKVKGPFEDTTLQKLSKMSPTSLKVTHKQLVEGAKKDFRECFEMEIGMAEEFMSQKDFFEGVRSILVDKDRNPKWDPATLPEVSDDAVAEYFHKQPRQRQRYSMNVISINVHSGKVPERFYDKF